MKGFVEAYASVGLLRSRLEGPYPFWDVKDEATIGSFFLYSRKVMNPYLGSSEHMLG